MPQIYGQVGRQLRYRLYQRLPAFKWRNFRLLFGGQLFSLSGTFMTQQLTVPWLVYDLTQSAWLLGLAGFLQFLPTIFLIPLSGVLADRWNRRDLLLLVQVLGISVSATLTALTFLGLIQFESLLILSVLNGLLKGLDMPVRHTIVTETVDDRRDWSNAIALNSVMLSSSLVLGPALGGILIATLGVKYCFLYDTLSYIAAIVTLQAMHLKPMVEATTDQVRGTWQKLREGWQYAVKTQPIRAILLLLASKSLFGMAYIYILPVFAADVLQGDATTMATLGTAGPIGAFLATGYLSLRRGIAGLERVMMIGQGAIGFSLIAFALSRQLWLSVPLLVLVGGFSILQITSSNTLIQTLVADDKRGRVMSFYALAMVGMMPFSNLLAGGLAQGIGAPAALVLCGSACIVMSIWFASQVSAIARWIQQETAPAQPLPDVSRI